MFTGLTRREVFLYAFACVVASAVLNLRSEGQVTVATYHNDKGRTGHNRQETILTPANVNSSQFGKLFSQPVDGYIYTQPLYVPNVAIPNQGTHNVVFVATEHDSVYAFDADNNTGSNEQPLWKVSFIDPAKGITPLSSDDVGCPDLVTSEIGITGTPVIRTRSGTLYVLARTKESGVFYQRLHALDITSGAEKIGGPVVIQASVPGSGSGSVDGFINFDPLVQNQRAALLFQNKLVYIAWGSLCDNGAYHGWLMAYDSKTLEQKAAWVTTPNGSRGAIWQSGSGPAGDASFNTYAATGNGTFDANTGGADYGQSILKLAPPSNGGFSVSDYFTPFNGPSLNKTDKDIGSGGVAILPDQPKGPHLHLLVQADKQGTIYLVDRDNMGHFNSVDNSQIVQSIPGAVTGMWNSPAWWNNNLYIAGRGDYLKVFSFNTTTGLLSTTPPSQTSRVYAYPGTTPSISSNQDSNGIVWALNNATYKKSTGAVLHAYDATDLSIQLYSSKQNASRDNPGGAVKFAVPTVANGKVYVGTQTQLSVYGLLGAAPRPAAKRRSRCCRGEGSTISQVKHRTGR